MARFQDRAMASHFAPSYEHGERDDSNHESFVTNQRHMQGLH